MKRRHWLQLGVAAAAAAGGAGFAWWRLRLDAPPAELQALWDSVFDAPDGSAVRLQDFAGKPLLLNFWATWCPPCVREMPAIERSHQEFSPKGWQVIGIAVDAPTPVRTFLQRIPVSFPIALAGFGGTELARNLGNTGGGLPFTVALNAAGRIAQRKLGETTYDELAQWAGQ